MGALWAACAWLLVGYRVADSSETQEFIDRLNLGWLPSFVWLSAGGLLVYLLGSLLVVRTNPLERPLDRVRHKLAPAVKRISQDRPPARRRYRGVWHAWNIAPYSLRRPLVEWCADDVRDYSPIDTWLDNQFREHRISGRVPLMRSFFEGGCEPPSGFHAFYDADTFDSHLNTLEEPWEVESSAASSFRWAVKREQSAVEVRIQMRFPDVYAEIDRLKVEAELRMSIFWPLMILSVLLAFMWSPYALVVGLLPPWLLRDAAQRAKEASDKTWGTVVAGEITTPILDQMKSAASEDLRDFRKWYGPEATVEQDAAEVESTGPR